MKYINLIFNANRKRTTRAAVEICIYVGSAYMLFSIFTRLTRECLCVFFSILLVLLFFQQVFLWLGKSILNERVHVLNSLTPLTAKEKCALADDLRTTNNGKLDSLWNDSAKEGPIKVFLTGVTGYVGKATLHEILCMIATDTSAHCGNHRVFVSVRTKEDRRTGSSFSGVQRVQKMKEDPIFSEFATMWDETIEAIEVADLSIPSCGLSTAALKKLQDSKITHLVHCAAEVKFEPPLDEIAAANVTSTLQMQAFAREWGCKKFVYVSTAFVNPNGGSPDQPILEEIVPLGKYNALDLYKSMLGDQYLARKACKELGFPNNYVFSKCVCENLISYDKETPTCIIRPSIVGPAWITPYRGWNGDRSSTVTAVLTMCRMGLGRAFCNLDCRRPVAPVDWVAVSIVDAMIGPISYTDRPLIRNVTWQVKCEEQVYMFWALTGRVSPTYVVMVIVLGRFLRNYPRCFDILHRIVNVAPVLILDQVEKAKAQLIGQNKKLARKPSTKSLLGFLEMLRVTVPFVDREVHFLQSCRIPRLLTQESYHVCLITACEGFVPPKSRPVSPDLEASPGEMGVTFVNLFPKDRFDLWWAMTMPNGNVATRIAAYLVSTVLRQACGTVVVDLRSIVSFSRELEKDRDSPLCLVPTHRSFLDFILISYMCFSMPGLGLKIPKIAAATEFQALSFARLLQWANAFWVERNSLDESLAPRLQSIIADGNHLMVFLEGTRSRDRRFLRPRTGFLRALQHSSRRAAEERR